MRKSTILFLASSFLLAAASYQSVFAGAAAPAAKKIKYAEVQKIFDANCIGCHGDHGRGGIDLTNYDSVIQGGDDGKIVKPGDPDHSVIVRAVKAEPGVRHMPPPPRTKLEDKDIATLSTWVKQGANK